MSASHGKRKARPSGTAAGWILWLWLLGSGLAGAHPILQNPIFVTVRPDRLEVKLYVSLRELNVVQGLPIAGDGAVDFAEAVETAPRHTAYVLDHLSFKADGPALQGVLEGIDPPGHVGKGVEGPDRAHFIYRLRYPMAVPPGRILFQHTMVKEFPSAPGVPWDLSYNYRFGPPDAAPLLFGAAQREVEVSYETGFAPPAGGRASVPEAAAHGPVLWRLMLLGAALGLGTGSRAGMGRLALGLTASLLIGWGLGWAAGWGLPGFLAAALGAIGILLAAVDNIHRAGPAAPPAAPLRRMVLTGFFPAVSGLAAWGMAGAVPFSRAGWLGLCLTGMLGAATLGAAFARSGMPPPESTPSVGPTRQRPVLQVLSLLVCLGGLVVLFDGLGIRPWAYWLTRLRG